MTKIEKEVKDFRKRRGLFHNVPRSLKNLVRRRLKALESDVDRFDREALLLRPQLKRLYALLHIAPNDWAQASLFGEAPENSSVAAVAQLAIEKDAEKAAKIVRDYRLPYLLTESAVGRLTDPVAIALIETLPSHELLSRLRLFAKRGLLKGAVTKALKKRLKAMSHDSDFQLSYRKAESVCRLAELEKSLATLVMALVTTESKGESLSGSTALLIDASLSIAENSDTLCSGSELVGLIDDALSEDDQFFLGFFGSDFEVSLSDRKQSRDAWESKVTEGLSEAKREQGSSVGGAVQALLKQCPSLERLLVLTDGYENRGPRLHQALNEHRAETGSLPALCLVLTHDSGRQMAVDLKQHQIPFEVFQLQKELIGMDAIIATLQETKQNDDVAAILNYPLD